MKNLKGKTVFITGASSGFGKATAYKFAEHGCNLILCARRFDKLKKIEQDIKKKFKIKILAFELDVRKQKDVKNKIAKFSTEWKKIDILINHAD
jgi:NADP-dependent 3-hydroxy acid dehydrogenase YdfG